MTTNLHNTPDREIAVARFGSRIAAVLNTQAQQTHPDVAARLQFAREQALQKARQRRTVAQTQTGGLLVGEGVLAFSGARRPEQPEGSWWLRLSSLLPLAALIAGLVAIEQWHEHRQIQAAAEIDSALLSDSLPPEAYRDPGFAEFLKQSRE